MAGRLYNKNTFVLDGTSVVGREIVRIFLLEGATVIVPAKSSTNISDLKEYLQNVKTGKLITFLTDVEDFKKASDISEILREVYGPIDITVALFENDTEIPLLTLLKITEIEKTINNNASICFICSQIFFKNAGETARSLMISVKRGHAGQQLNATNKIQTCIAAMIGQDLTKVETELFHFEVESCQNESQNATTLAQYIITVFLDKQVFTANFLNN